MTPLIQMLGWLALIGVNVLIDYRLIKSGKGVNHVFETIIRIAAGILYAGLLFGVRRPDEHAGWVAMFQATSFWIFFELGLNLSRGLEPFYVGETAKSDRFFRNNMPIFLMLKVFALVFLITSIVQLLKGN
jgi:hypothetical protein